MLPHLKINLQYNTTNINGENKYIFVIMSWLDISHSDSVRGFKGGRDVEGSLLVSFFDALNEKDFIRGKKEIKTTILSFGYHIRTSHGGTYHGTGEQKAWELDHYA